MKELNDWFQNNRRVFPWREDPTPYRVWVSEVMLQQTRAVVVIPYFLRWMELFPHVEALAQAPLEKVIKTWEGLGYYSRARNLHAGAKQIVEQFNGKIPNNRQDLESIRGLGPYTVGAILSFGFQQRAAAVDGNVMRVLSRYLLIEEDICKQAVKKRIQAKAEELLDGKEPWITAEALIELGATVCQPKPQCPLCPLQKSCQALRQKKTDSLPIKKAEVKTTVLHRAVLVVEAEGHLLVRKGTPGQVMADLYEFPYFEMEEERWSSKKMAQEIQNRWGIAAEFIRKLPRIKHTFTRFEAHLFPVLLKAAERPQIESYEWILLERLPDLPFSSGHRKILSLRVQ